MFKITIQTKKGSAQATLEAETSLLASTHSMPIELTHRCGGHARCGTCLVTVTEGLDKLSPIGSTELKILKVLKANDQQRLACQAWTKNDTVCRQD